MRLQMNRTRRERERDALRFNVLFQGSKRGRVDQKARVKLLREQERERESSIYSQGSVDYFISFCIKM